MNGECDSFEPGASSEAEAGILGVLMWLPDSAPPRLAKVDVEFHDTRHRLILQTIRTLHGEGKRADLTAVLTLLDERKELEETGGREYLVRIVDTACFNGAHQFDSYVERVKERGATEGSEGSEGSEGEGGEAGREGAKLLDDVRETVKEKNPTEGCEGARLLDDLRELFARHVVLPPHAAEALALWTLHTYAWKLRSVTTYLGIVSPVKRCGKTTVLTLLNKVADRTEFASNVSPPSIYRVIEERQPTLLIDEGDTFLRGRDELRGILNAGYTRDSAYVLRAGGEGQALRRYSCWCPKAIATIGGLPETLADRCVMITMRRKTASEKCARLRNFDGSELRARCERWVAEHSDAIGRHEPVIPEVLNDRAADIWEPLLTLAELAGRCWPELGRAAAIGLSASAVEQDFTTRLLADIEIVFEGYQSEKLFSRELVEGLLRLPERPWRELRRGGAVNELWLAEQLSRFGIHSRTIRIGGAVGRGYYVEDFRDTFGRYLGKAA